MTAKDARSVTIGLSVEQLESAGIDDDEVDDNALATIVDMVVMGWPQTIEEAVQFWRDNIREEDHA